jgi:ABC-2 type transport system ATP-binding protein
MLATGTVDEVIRAPGLTTFVVEGPGSNEVADALEGEPGVEQVAPFGTTLHVVGSDAAALEATLAPLKAGRAEPAVAGETSLEDVFIQFMAGSKDNMA